jgi:hypothetical protein
MFQGWTEHPDDDEIKMEFTVDSQTGHSRSEMGNFKERRKSWRPRVSLLALFVLLTLFAMLFAGIRYRLEQIAVQQRSIDELQAAGFSSIHIYKPLAFPDTILSRVFPVINSYPAEVAAPQNRELTAEDCANLVRFNDTISSLSLNGSWATDETLDNLDELHELRVLLLSDTRVTKIGAERFRARHPKTQVIFPQR